MTSGSFSLKVNGKPVEVRALPAQTLLNVLRENLNLTGAKEGCGKGECGACTVLMNGDPICSCLVMISQADGSEILTIEGIERDGAPHRIQQAFIEEGAVQCGYCTPGIIVTCGALLARNPRPTELEVREAISGNLCRCTGYQKIVRAILKVSETARLGNATMGVALKENV